ncbi:MAG TPA: ATP-dependent Clp protease ATP-binding subunit ClpA, partial [Rectinema sp.]|nr:ATP-dependent Clp protease ATP-binding subunit ClpA [Rectinema sp.]HOO01374.1 ATP-dependent Clp protease ATP-binding subunit ClpA [Rectinema sp.]HPB61432.1 ATP-dependent Clp protease ATP-binding subunit ClpA [Rectinema sp.]
AGARDIGKPLIGFGDQQVSSSALDDAVERAFSPEFRNRLDAVVHFNNLPMEIIERIVKKAIDEFAMQLAEKNVTLRVEDDVIRYLAIKGYSREFGARNISRLVEDQIKTVFVDEVLFGRLEHGGTAIARLENDKIVFDISPKNDS